MTSGYRRRAATAPDVQPDINVTPLVDVVLVLLIIFMVVAPRLDQDVAVELPGIFNPDPDVKADEPFKVSVPKAGRVSTSTTRSTISIASSSTCRPSTPSTHCAAWCCAPTRG